MDYLIKIIVGVVLIVTGLKVLKYLLFKKTFKFVTTIIIILLLFLCFCYTFKDLDSLQDNKFVQTGAVVADGFADLLKEKEGNEGIINPPLKSNKLFKSQKYL